MKPAKPITMWAAVVSNPRGEWIHRNTLRRTRKEARAAYLDQWAPWTHKKVLKRIRFARVTVALAWKEQG